MADLIERFETEHGCGQRPGTATRLPAHAQQSYPTGALKHLKVGGRHLRGCRSACTAENYQSWTSLPAPIAFIAVLSKMFALAIRWNMRDDNPCVGIERNVEHSRRRYLKDDELARLVMGVGQRMHRTSKRLTLLRAAAI